MENFKKLLEIQKNEAQKIIDNKYYNDEEKIERIDDLFLGDTDLTDLDEFKNDEDLDLMQELRAEAKSDFLWKVSNINDEIDEYDEELELENEIADYLFELELMLKSVLYYNK